MPEWMQPGYGFPFSDILYFLNVQMHINTDSQMMDNSELPPVHLWPRSTPMQDNKADSVPQFQSHQTSMSIPQKSQVPLPAEPVSSAP